MYKSIKQAIANLKIHDYDFIHIYAIDDEISREEFEKRGVE